MNTATATRTATPKAQAAQAPAPAPDAVVSRRHEFVLFFEVTDGNPNGDPDAGNQPRVDPETEQGLVTDVCLKRKVRNYVELARGDDDGPAEGYDIYVKDRGILVREHRRAYQALDLVPDNHTATIEQAREWMCRQMYDVRAFGAVMSTGKAEDDDAGKGRGKGKGKGKAAGKNGKAAARAATGPVAEAEPDAEAEAEADAGDDNPDDVARGTRGKKLWNCGQVRGPIQLGFARSIDPIRVATHTITRVALVSNSDTKKGREEGLGDGDDDRAASGQIGRKHTVPYGLYRAHGFVSPALAADTGFTEADLELLWDALLHMFEIDRSASRGVMATRKLVVFRHQTPLGNAPAHALLDLVRARRVDPARPPRCYADYEITVAPCPYPLVEVLEKG
jgi:CRISPR-associated protein Csd2